MACFQSHVPGHTRLVVGERRGSKGPEAEAGVEMVGGLTWRREQDAAEEAVFCELSSYC